METQTELLNIKISKKDLKRLFKENADNIINNTSGYELTHEKNILMFKEMKGGLKNE